jgi:hypothetical protein
MRGVDCSCFYCDIRVSLFISLKKSDYRSKLGSNMIEALICLQDWLRGNGKVQKFFILK